MRAVCEGFENVFYNEINRTCWNMEYRRLEKNTIRLRVIKADKRTSRRCIPNTSCKIYHLNNRSELLFKIYDYPFFLIDGSYYCTSYIYVLYKIHYV